MIYPTSVKPVHSPPFQCLHTGSWLSKAVSSNMNWHNLLGNVTASELRCCINYLTQYGVGWKLNLNQKRQDGIDELVGRIRCWCAWKPHENPVMWVMGKFCYLPLFHFIITPLTRSLVTDEKSPFWGRGGKEHQQFVVKKNGSVITGSFHVFLFVCLFVFLSPEQYF